MFLHHIIQRHRPQSDFLLGKILNKMYFPILICTHRTESKPELVKTEMGPPPSPASTCSDTSSIASSASLPYSMSASLSHSLLTSSSHNNTWVSYSLTISPALNQSLPHSVFSLLVWLWNRWRTGFYQQLFLPACFPVKAVQPAHCLYCAVYLFLVFTSSHMKPTVGL